MLFGTQGDKSPSELSILFRITFSGATQGVSVPTPRQIEPMFHTVPPRPQRLLHSEAYIR